MQNRRLFEYAENGDLIPMVEMLSRGVDINWRNPDRFGQTALHIASANGHIGVVKTLLLRSEIDPNAKDDFGWTPLHLASLYSSIGTEEVVDELIQLPKIDLNAKTAWGWTFLDIALKVRNSDIINLPSEVSDVEFLLDEVNTVYDQLLHSQIMSDTDLAESFKKQATMAKRLESIWSQLRHIDTLIDFNLKEIEAILQSESADFPDLRSKMNKIVRNLSNVKYHNRKVMKVSAEQNDAGDKDEEDFEVGINPLATNGIDFDDLKNMFQTTYSDDKFAQQNGSEFHILSLGGFGELKSMPTNVTSGALVTLSIILLAVFSYSYIHYYQARTSKMTFQERWNIKSLPWTMTFGLISWILNMLKQASRVEWKEEFLNTFENLVAKSEMPKDKAKTANINIKEMKNHYEDQLRQLHTVYEARIGECGLEFVEKQEKLHSEIEMLKTEMTRMKNKMGMLSERPTNVEANPVRSPKRGRSVGHQILKSTRFHHFE